MAIVLTNIYEVEEPYTGKSKKELFNTMSKGDRIRISIELVNKGGYVPTILIESSKMVENERIKFNNFANYLSKIKLVKVDE